MDINLTRNSSLLSDDTIPSFIPSYRPEIDYSWTTTNKSGNRQLINAGKSNPSYKATMYSGRGLKFNGTDQSVDTGVYTITGNTTISFSFIPNKANGQLCILGGARIMLHSNKLQMDLRGSGGLPDVFVSSVLDITKSYGVSIVFYADKIETWLNGILDTVTITPTIGLAYRYIGQRGNSKSFSESTISNITIINHALTPYEIKYQYNHPEKFLYHEKQTDGTFVAKSKILTQDKIDNTVAHFPMCETDGFIRNMIGYSESINKIDYENIVIDEDGDGVSTLTLLSDGFEIEQDGSGSLEDKPTIKIPFINAETQIVGNTYIIEYDASIISGENNSKKQNILGQSISVVLGTNYYLYTTMADIKSGSFTFDSTVAGKMRIDNIQVKKLTSTYPVENFTNAARDDARNLTTGLQTCLWKRDVLGVPTAGSFDEITFDGVGYVDTGWVPTLDFQLEVVVSWADIKSGLGYFGSYNSGKNRFTFGKGSGSGTMYWHCGTITDGSNVIGYAKNNEKLHLLLVRENSLNKNIAYLNGNKKAEFFSNFDGSIHDFFMPARGAVTNIETNAIVDLFKVHTTPQDPAKLYNDAVKKGLLS